MNNLKSTENIKFNNAIYKTTGWQEQYEGLFIDIIPITWKTIRKLLLKINCSLLDDGDYLTISFLTYNELISNLQNNPKIINHELEVSFDEFLRNYVIKLYNNCRKLIRELQINKSNILNLCNYPYDSYLSNEKTFITNNQLNQMVCQPDSYSRIYEFIKSIENNQLWTKIVYFKLKGLNNKQVAKKLTLSEAKICRTIKQLRKVYQIMLNKEYIQTIK